MPWELNMVEYEEHRIAGILFRIPKERSILQEGKLEKIYQKDKSIGVHEVIMIDCEIQDKETKIWRAVTEIDLRFISRTDGIELNNIITRIRQSERDFITARQELEKKPAS